MSISANYSRIRQEVPDYVTILVSCKTRTTEEIEEVINAGATDIGENYVQEAGQIYGTLRKKTAKLRWHMIGHLQTNKINKALRIFDVIQTVDSLVKAAAIDKRLEKARKQIMPVFVIINIGSEDSKVGIKPEEHEPFEEKIVSLKERLLDRHKRNAFLRSPETQGKIDTAKIDLQIYRLEKEIFKQACLNPIIITKEFIDSHSEHA